MCVQKSVEVEVRGYIALGIYMLYWSYAFGTRTLSGGKTRHILYQSCSIVKKKLKKEDWFYLSSDW